MKGPKRKPLEREYPDLCKKLKPLQVDRPGFCRNNNWDLRYVQGDLLSNSNIV